MKEKAKIEKKKVQTLTIAEILTREPKLKELSKSVATTAASIRQKLEPSAEEIELIKPKQYLAYKKNTNRKKVIFDGTDLKEYIHAYEGFIDMYYFHLNKFNNDNSNQSELSYIEIQILFFEKELNEAEYYSPDDIKFYTHLHQYIAFLKNRMKEVRSGKKDIFLNNRVKSENFALDLNYGQLQHLNEVHEILLTGKLIAHDTTLSQFKSIILPNQNILKVQWNKGLRALKLFVTELKNSSGKRIDQLIVASNCFLDRKGKPISNGQLNKNDNDAVVPENDINTINEAISAFRFESLTTPT